jgi:hypothetical protein
LEDVLVSVPPVVVAPVVVDEPPVDDVLPPVVPAVEPPVDAVEPVEVASSLDFFIDTIVMYTKPMTHSIASTITTVAAADAIYK